MPTPPAQPDLFDAEPAGPAPAPAPPDQPLVRVAGPAATLRKAQREFNRASERLAALRAHLTAWRAAEDACHRRAATDLAPLQARLTALQRETVLWADAYLARPPAGEKLPKKHRAKLVAMLRLLAQHVLQSGPDEAVEAAHDRHSPSSHREQQQEQADLAAAMLGRAMGDDSLFDGEAESVEALLKRAGERLRERADDEAAQPPPEPPPGARPTRADKTRAREAQALQAASQSVRDVYRRLASSLHPDREPDAAERARKTVLMARVNEAYGRNDLLALLQVQMDIEQIDAQHLAQVSDDRLRHYTRVLKEQQQALEEELAGVQAPVADHLGRPPAGLAWPPRLLSDALDDDIDRVREALHHLGQDSLALRDPRTRTAVLRVLEVPDPDDQADPFEELLLMEALADLGEASARPPQSAPRGGGGGGRGGRRRRRR